LLNNYPEAIYAAVRGRIQPKTWKSCLLREDDTREGALLEIVNTNVRGMIRKYLHGHFGANFFEGGIIEEDGWVEPFDGFLQEGDVTSLVEIIPVSSLTYETYISRVVDKMAPLVAAKAHIAGLDEGLLILFDRNKSGWCAYEITGDFDAAAKNLQAYLAGGKPTTVRSRLAHRVTQALDGYLFGLNLKPREGRVRHAGIHPSEFSVKECDRLIAYTVMGVDEKESTDPGLRRIFDVGHACHDALQGALGEAFGDQFRAEVPIVNKGLRMVGHCDGVLGDEGFEIKSIGDNGHKKLRKAKPEHQKQGVLYAANLALTSVNYLYANKETGELTSYPVALDRTLWQSMAARATRIIRAVDAGLLPDRIPNERACEGCKYAWTCRPERIRR